MHWICWVAMVICCLPLTPRALGEVYVRQQADCVILGNQYLERRIALQPWVCTSAFTNKLTERTFEVSGDGFRIALAAETVTLTSRDFQLNDRPALVDGPAGARAVVCTLTCPAHEISLDVRYELRLDDFATRKRLTIRAGAMLVNWVEVERFRISDGASALHLQRFDQDPMPFRSQPWDVPTGRPVYIADELFAGLEYPAGHNGFDESGTIALRHYPGRAGLIETRPAVLGVAPNTPLNRVNDWFLRYIDRNRARPVQRSVQWVAYFAAGQSDELSREKVDIAKQVFADRNVHLDCILMDSGWTDPQSIMRISPRRPDRLALVRELARTQLNTGLGLHVITSGVKPMVDKDWLAEQGYDLIWHRSRRDGAYCLGDPRVREEFQRNLVQHVQDYDLAAYKFDWGYFACEREGHRGHLPGLDYGIEANTDNFIRVLEALRQAKPDIFLFNTGYYSPWWLFWYDAVFSAGADYNFSLRCCPAFTTCSALGTWRDAVVRGNLVQWSPCFPLSSLMHVSPINHWWHDWNARYQERLDRFTDYVLMSYMRGSQMTEIYLNIAALTEPHRDALAAVMNWAADNDDILLADTRLIGGDPLAGEVYGYAHVTRDHRGLVAVRNPHVEPADFTLQLDESAGIAPEASGLVAEIIYPYRLGLAAALKHGDGVQLHLESHETLILRLQPEAQLTEPLPLACRFLTDSASTGSTRCRLVGRPGERTGISFAGNAKPADVLSALADFGAARAQDRVEFTFPGKPAEPMALAHVTVRAESSDIAVAFTAQIANGTSAAAVLWADRPGLEATAELNGQTVDVEAPHIQLDDAKEPARTYGDKVYSQRAEYGLNAKGNWSLFRVPLGQGASRVQLRLTCPDLARIRIDLQSKPAGAVPMKTAEMQLSGLLQTVTDLCAGPVVTLPARAAARGTRPSLPQTWAQQQRKTSRLFATERLQLRSTQQAAWYTSSVGARLFTDAEVSITELPAQLEGLPALALSRSVAARDSRLSLSFAQATRLVVAFGGPDGDARYLSPQPGWSRWSCTFSASDPGLSPGLYVRDFPKGEAELFLGCKGAVAVVAALAQPQNLVQVSTLSASATFDAVHLPQLAVDGDPKTDWWSANGLPQWLLLDLGKAQWLSRVDLTFYHRDTRHYQYVIETSSDGEGWTPAVDASKNTQAAAADGTQHWFSRRQARFVRITVTGGSEAAAHISEVRILDDPMAPSE